jgi:hypothetical protein
MKTPPGSPWTRRHFLPRQERYRWQADKSRRRFRKTPCLFRDEKYIAAGGEESVGGPDEIKRRDSGSFRSVARFGSKPAVEERGPNGYFLIGKWTVFEALVKGC